jgi:hypothetical protein
MEWHEVLELIDELIGFYDEKIEDSPEWPVDHRDIYIAAKEKVLKKREAVVAKLQEQDKAYELMMFRMARKKR